MKRRMLLLMTAIVLIVATALITREYTIKTAQPDRACYINFNGELHHYEQKGVDYMWRVSWSGNFCEFGRCFGSKEEAEKFYNSISTKHKQIYFA